MPAPVTLTYRRASEIKRGQGGPSTPEELAQLFKAQARVFPQAVTPEEYARRLAAYVDGLFERSRREAASAEEVEKALQGASAWQQTRRQIPLAVKLLRPRLTCTPCALNTNFVAARPRERRARRATASSNNRGDPDPEPEPPAVARPARAYSPARGQVPA